MKDSTRRTLRTAFAVLVALAAGAPVLVHEAGLKPDQWPWLATVLAVAAGITRLLASQAVEDLLARFAPWLSAGPSRPGRHELGGTAGDPAMGRDAGSARIRAVLAVAFALLLVGFTAATAQAHWPHRQPRTNLPGVAHWPSGTPIPEPDRDSTIYWIGANAWSCEGVLWVAYSEQNLVGGRLVARQSDGAAKVQVHDYSGRFGPYGEWLDVPVDRDNGSHLGWSGFLEAQQSGGHMDLVRVVHTKSPRITSAVASIQEVCPA